MMMMMMLAKKQRYVFFFLFFVDGVTFQGSVIGVSFYTLPNLCEIAPEGSSPSCHLGDGFSDLVIIKRCSRLQMNSHIQRNFNSKDQVRMKYASLSFPPSFPSLSQVHKAVTHFCNSALSTEGKI